ncbi:MAG: hypothetical protein VKK04_12635 [Synechococcales bacterium]|nr:hypothetical protein [Synechococcales bacterium]
MNRSIPASPQEIAALRSQPIDADLVAAAIAGVINLTRSQGRSLDDLTQEVLADDRLLDWEWRCLLSEIVAQAWECLHPPADADAAQQP